MVMVDGEGEEMEEGALYRALSLQERMWTDDLNDDVLQDAAASRAGYACVVGITGASVGMVIGGGGLSTPLPHLPNVE